MKKISLIIPVFNEEETINLFIRKASDVLIKIRYNYELIFVNDGSTDSSLEILKRMSTEYTEIKILNLSRNFGKEQALTAGLDFSEGDAVIPIDCDMQDPPELIPEMIQKWEQGYDIVMAKRKKRKSDGFLKRASAYIYYKLLSSISDNKIPENVGDYRLIDKRVVEAIKMHPERSRFMKGLFASVGFKQTIIEYERAVRISGISKMGLAKLLKLAIEGIVAYSSLPLKIWSYIGAFISISAIFYGCYLILKTVFLGVDVPGYASIMVVLLIMTGSILLSLGIIGEYLSRIYNEVKHRPIYIIESKIGFGDH